MYMSILPPLAGETDMTQKNQWQAKCYDCPEASEWLATQDECLEWHRAHKCGKRA